MALIYKIKLNVGGETYNALLPILYCPSLPPDGTTELSGSYLVDGINFLKTFLPEDELMYIGGPVWFPFNDSFSTFGKIKGFYPFSIEAGEFPSTQDSYSFSFNVAPDYLLTGGRSSGPGSSYNYVPVRYNNIYVDEIPVAWVGAPDGRNGLRNNIIICNSNDKIREDTVFKIIRVGTILENGSFKNRFANVYSESKYTNRMSIKEILGGKEPDYNTPDNPYSPGGDSGEGGGNGNFDDTSDPIPDSSIPTLSSSNTGFTRIYNPTLAQVQDLAQYLWTDETVIETIWNHIKQYFEDPMQAIIGFNLVPCAVPNGGTKNFALMYIDTGVAMTVAANQFVDVDCGTCEISEYFGSALDYSPYTKISCFLPFIGTVQLNTDEVMKTTLQVKYRIDICSGSCVAKILVNGNVLYQYSGHCAIPIPFSASDFSAYVSSAISVAKLAIGAAAGGAMSALMADVPNPTQQTHRVVTTSKSDTERNPTTGRQITTGTMRKEVVTDEITEKTNTQASFSGLSPANIANTVGQIMGSKPYVEHSGSFSGNTGYLGVRRPYLIIQRPNMCMPAQYQQLNGFPSMITEELSSLKGFTRVQQVQLTGMSATNPEQAEILEMLKSGVII